MNLKRQQRPPNRRRSPIAAALAAACLVSLVAAACGSSHKSAAPTTLPASSTSSPTFKQPTSTVSVPTYNPAKNVRRDVQAGACVDQGSKGWALSGKVTNSSTKPQGYSIVVDFITVPGDTVLDTKLVSVPTVQPHASATWSATGAAPGEKNLTCVIRQSLST
jgi:hypothetical protein